MLKWIIQMSILAVGLSAVSSLSASGSIAGPKAWTIMCYMNGDNDLGTEVLHAVDMLETAGSSPDLNLIVMVDAHPDAIGKRSPDWAKSRILYITPDDRIGALSSVCLAGPEEVNMADPKTLQGFVRYARTHFPAKRYLFATFTHGRGIIDYRQLNTRATGRPGSICPDDTSQSAMTIEAFSQSVRSGMGGEQLDLMVFFSCLTNMVEVGYAFKDVTKYLVASPAVIHLVDSPPGRFQLRGIRLEKLVELISDSPRIDMAAAARFVVEDYVDQYRRGVMITDSGGSSRRVSYPGVLTAVDCAHYGPLVNGLERLSAAIVETLKGGDTAGMAAISRLRSSADRVQKYRSFMNLEYVDLTALLEEVIGLDIHWSVTEAAKSVLEIVNNELIVYGRHSDNGLFGGVSIFFPDYRIPDNIFNAHRNQYAHTDFGKETNWMAFIDRLRYLPESD
jgi:hypothetical protein